MTDSKSEKLTSRNYAALLDQDLSINKLLEMTFYFRSHYGLCGVHYTDHHKIKMYALGKYEYCVRFAQTQDIIAPVFIKESEEAWKSTLKNVVNAVVNIHTDNALEFLTQYDAFDDVISHEQICTIMASNSMSMTQFLCLLPKERTAFHQKLLGFYTC